MQRYLTLSPLLAAAAGMLEAQGPSARAGLPDAGSVSGSVVAAATSRPIPGAVVILEAAGDAVLASSSSAFIGRTRSAITDREGAYRFIDLPAGSYRLVVRHLGYHPAFVEIELARAEPFRVSVGLVINPIRLEPISARAAVDNPYGRTYPPDVGRQRGRMEAEEWRDSRFLEGDAAVLTHADVVEAVTLGETDLFRALQRLPGVSTRDDFTAGLWTRGATWSQTRVYFDGIPLFNPVHAIGLLGGVNPDAVGAVSFHPGARSAAIGEGAAGVLDVRSRRAARPGLQGLGEMSVLSARASAAWGSPGGRTGIVLAARRSYVDLATRLAELFGADSGSYIPYAFYDLSGRLDALVAPGTAIEASGLIEEDGVRGGVPGLLRSTTGTWGNRLGRLSLLAPLGGLRTRTTAGVSRFAGTVNARNRDTVTSVGYTRAVPIHEPTRNAVTVVSGSFELGPDDAGARPAWAAGVQLSLQRQGYVGQYPRPYPVAVLPDTLVLRERLYVGTLWGERRMALGRHAAVEAGLRLEAHEGVRNAAPLSLAPKLAARATIPGTRLSLTAAVARTYQYTQALAPAGPSVGPDLYLTDVWLLAGDTIPALRSDVATLGAELWMGGGWIAAANGYLRRATGVAVPEPGPGKLSNSRPIFVEAENRARGLELSVRRLAGQWSVAGSYSYGFSTLGAHSRMFPVWYRFPSPADRSHSVDLTATALVSRSVRLGAALTAATGAPFSRFLLGAAPCDSTGCVIGDSTALYIESPNAVRAPGYASLDLLADWSRTVGSVRVGAFVQVRNVLNLRNAVTYTGTVPCAQASAPRLVEVGDGYCDRFDRGVPILPLVGLRVAF